MDNEYLRLNNPDAKKDGTINVYSAKSQVQVVNKEKNNATAFGFIKDEFLSGETEEVIREELPVKKPKFLDCFTLAAILILACITLSVVALTFNEYFFLQPAGEVGGYICLKPYPDYLFLSKFYILKEHRGKGYGKKAFEFMVDYAKRHNLNKIKVSVNKYNVNSIAVYEKLGFCRGQATCTDIGNGFVMDDYEYICEL